MTWSVIFEPDTLWLYARGLWATFYMLVGLLFFGGLIAVGTALLLTSRIWIVRKTASVFTYFIRGTPLLIQIYLIYFGIAQLGWVQSLWDTVWPWTYFKNPLFCAMLAFSLNHAGYAAEIWAGAMRETSKGEVEAAYAIGMSRWMVMRRIVMPSAFRRALPAYGNEVMQMMHGTSLASTVPALMEITGAARKIYSDYYLAFEPLLFAAGIYLLITFSMMAFFRWLENRYVGYLKPMAS